MLGKPNALSKGQIVAALSKLNEYLKEKEVVGEVCLFGGTVMVLAFNARLTTRDVDAVFKPASLLREYAARVAGEENLPEGWLNDGVKGFQSDRAELTSDTLPQFSHLRLLRPTAEYLLAMKCLASRAGDSQEHGDRADILFLIKHLGLRTEEQVLANITRFYPPERILPKTQFMIHEVIAQASKES